jgi:hypothetical protein
MVMKTGDLQILLGWFISTWKKICGKISDKIPVNWLWLIRFD